MIVFIGYSYNKIYVHIVLLRSCCSYGNQHNQQSVVYMQKT